MTSSLSVCIPTRNRLNFLQGLLPDLLGQASRALVQVCVSDNNSSDGTADYLEKLSTQFSCLKFVIQKESLSIDQSMTAAILMGDSDYIYPLGDDDYLPGHSLSTILSDLVDHPDLLILNASHTDADLNFKKESFSEELKGKYFTASQEVFAKIPHPMHFSAFVVRQEILSEQSFYRYWGTSHAYAGVVWDGLLNKENLGLQCLIKFQSTPTVKIRGGEKSWKNDAASVNLYQVPLWFRLLDNSYQPSFENFYYPHYMRKNFKFLNLLKYACEGSLTKAFVIQIKPQLEITQKINLYITSNLPCSYVKLLMKIYKIHRNFIGFSRKILRYTFYR